MYFNMLKKTQKEKLNQLFAIKLKLQNHLLLIFFMLNDYYQLKTKINECRQNYSIYELLIIIIIRIEYHNYCFFYVLLIFFIL